MLHHLLRNHHQRTKGHKGMNLNFVGLTAALAAFLGIWLGHVAVRKIEAVVERLWVPIAVALALGLSLETWSLITDNWALQTATGILGVTLLWDSFEFWRQQKRVIKGHAPANPANPRHARILAESKSATTLSLLDRDPVGRPVCLEEAVQLATVNRQLPTKDK